MAEIVFALEFRGHASALPGSETRRQARTVASSQMLSTVLDVDGVRTLIEPVAGESAVLESWVERFGDGTFVEEGAITYGSAGSVTFGTIARGWVAPSPEEGVLHGAVMWMVTGGDGRFTGARGIITSNFTVSAAGDVVDDHFVRLYVPDVHVR
jgi:hypothetical protein